ncbi:MAG: protein kinase domain-containing protein [Myxococcaceae bacterium]
MSESPRLGKYTVLRKIGAGGMAEVYKCLLSCRGGFDKVVVLKQIRAELCEDPEFVEMFFEEARVAANLCHPNIVQTYEVDELSGVPHIAMEYVRGPTFSQLIRQQRKRGGPNLPIAAKVMAGVCEGLYYAHNALDVSGQGMGLIHRDVSPQNIIVSPEGTPKLVDFGVARARGRAQLTHAGTVKGKLRFMAPEQFNSPTAFDHRVDIFGAGVCLYYATTFHLPYGGDSDADVIRAASEGKYPKPSDCVPGYPSELEDIVLWAMAPNPADRCPDAQELHHALERYLARGTTAITHWSVRSHIRELFPDVENSAVVGNACVGDSMSSGRFAVPSPPLATEGLRQRTSASSVSLASAASVSSVSSPTSFDLDVAAPVNARRAPVMMPFLLGALFLAAIVGGIVTLRRRQHEPPPLAANTQKLETVALSSLLDEAQLALEQKEPNVAKAILGSARMLVGVSGPESELRLHELEEQLKVEEAKLRTASLVMPPPPASTREKLLPRLAAFESEREAEALRRALEEERETVARRAEAETRHSGVNETTSLSQRALAQQTDESFAVVMEDGPVERERQRRSSRGSERSRGKESSSKSKQSGGREQTVHTSASPAVAQELLVDEEPPAPAPSQPAPSVPSSTGAAPAVAARHPERAAPPPVEVAEPATGGAGLVDTAMEDTGPLDCPENGRVVGALPPRGQEIWCELADGSRHGKYLRFYANGVKAEEGEYRGGRKHGRWVEYYEMGAEREKTLWRRGVKTW